MSKDRLKQLREDLANSYGLMSPQAYFKHLDKYEEALLTTLQTEVEGLRKPEDAHQIDYDDIPVCYACNYEEALDDVLAIINKLRGGA